MAADDNRTPTVTVHVDSLSRVSASACLQNSLFQLAPDDVIVVAGKRKSRQDRIGANIYHHSHLIRAQTSHVDQGRARAHTRTCTHANTRCYR